MFCVKACLLFSLCILFFTGIEFVLSSMLSQLKETINSYGITSEVISQNISRIIINEKSYEIYNFDYETSDHSREYLTLNKLYVCINCKIAKWTGSKLFNYFELYPKIYTPEFVHQNKILFYDDDESLEIVLYNITTHIERFINILLNFASMYLNLDDTSVDTNILQALLSLNFKINIIKTLHIRIELIDDEAVIRLLLQVYNSIQTFMFLNCKLSSANMNNQFFSFQLRIDDSDEKNLDDFFKDIQLLNIEHHNTCNRKQILLFDMIHLRYIVWKTTNYTIKVNDVMLKIEETYDLEIIFWYQKFIFHTIMKILFTKVLNVLESENCISEKIVNELDELRSNILLNNIASISLDLRNCFFLLNKHRNLADFEDVELKNVMEKYINLPFDIELESYSDLIPIMVENNGNGNQNKLLNCTFNEFLGYLNANTEHLKCFMRLMEYLNSVNSKYFMPFTKNAKNITEFVHKVTTINETQISRKINRHKNKRKKQFNYDMIRNWGCQYFSGLYNLFSKTVTYLNLANDESQNNLKYYSRIEYRFKSANNLLIKLAEKNWNLRHFKVIFDIIPKIQVLNSNFFVPTNHDGLQRLLSVVMTNLNSYAIDHCSPPHYNYFINHNLIGYEIESQREIYDSILQLLDAIEINQNSKDAYNKFPNLKTVYRLVYQLDDFESYNNAIGMLWKGGRKDIKYIFLNINSAVLDSTSLYALYDYSFKFCLAALYFLIYKFFNEKSNLETSIPYILDLHLDESQFPDNFKYIVKRIISYKSSCENNQHNKIKREIMLLHKQFINVGVFVDLSNSVPYENIINQNVIVDSDAYDNNLYNSTNTSLMNILNLAYSINNIFLWYYTHIND